MVERVDKSFHVPRPNKKRTKFGEKSTPRAKIHIINKL